MAVFQEPTQWDHELGNNADVSTLPDDTSATTGVASLQKLFQIINQTPLEAGGVAPDREDFNALFKYLGDQIFYTQNGGVPSYNNSYDYAIGRVVLYNGNLYKCIQANGSSSTVVAPDSDDTYWQQLDGENTSTSLIPNQIITSPVPLTDANLHLLDGALLSGSGAYSAYVDLIAELYNGGTASTSFCTEAEWQTSNTNYGFCNKFVYDSVANTVRLPKVNSQHGALIKSYQSGDSWYRIYQDGFCEQGGIGSNFSSGDLTKETITLLKPFIDTNYSVLVNRQSTSTTQSYAWSFNKIDNSQIELNYNGGLSGKLEWSACGYTDISDLQTAPIYEYIVVGTVSKTDIQIDIDNVMSDLALKADKDLSNATPTSAFATAMNSANIRTVVETYVNGASWYRVYSDGFCIQGGHNTVNSNNTITLLKAFSNTDYIVNATTDQSIGSSVWAQLVTTKTVNNFVLAQNQSQYACYWTACGYVS
jgi:hypothetical protein